MAIWQFQFSLVPKAGIIKAHGRFVDVLPEYGGHDPEEAVKELSELNNYWEDIELSPLLIKSLELILPPQKSWSDDAKMFGSDDGNQIEVWDDDIVCALDVRNLDISLLSDILKVAKDLQCKIALKDGGRLIDPDFSKVMVEINNSHAMSFVQNPIHFIKNRSGRV